MDDKFRLRQKVAVLIACLPGILFRNASVFKHVRGETKIVENALEAKIAAQYGVRPSEKNSVKLSQSLSNVYRGTSGREKG